MIYEINKGNNNERLMGRTVKIIDSPPSNKSNRSFESELDLVVEQVEEYPEFLKMINKRDNLMMEISSIANEVQKLTMQHSDITTEINTYLQETFYKEGMQSRRITRDSNFRIYECDNHMYANKGLVNI